MQHAAQVTPSGVRDGDPDALDALCRRRGASVLAYCAEVCSEEDAGRAAAEAFARFRAAVVAIDDVSAIDPETLLLSATRHAAASLAKAPAGAGARLRLRRAPRPAPNPECDRVPELLVARAEGTISRTDQEILASHLDGCPTCGALREAFRRGEAAYREPRERHVPPDAATTIVAALVAAAPVAGAAPVLTDEDYAQIGEEGGEVPAATNVPPTQAEEEPAGDELPAAEDEEGEEAAARLARRRRRTRGEAEQAVARPVARRGEAERHEPAEPAGAARPHHAAPTARKPQPASEGSGGARPHSMARTARKPQPPVEHPRGGLRSAVLPGSIIAAAVAVALVIAGVFGDEGSDSLPQGTEHDQLFPTAVIRAPNRGTAAAAAAEIARQARLERLRIAREREARHAQGPSAAVAPTPPPVVAPGAATAQSPGATPPVASATAAPTAP